MSKKVAIIHDWLVTYAGAERVLEQILACYPQADLFSVCDFLPQSERRFLHGKKPQTTFIQKLPFAKTKYRGYLPLMPFAIEQLDLSAYDLVISSCHAVSKGVLTGPDQLHISYIHSPMRYAWDLQHQYLQRTGLDKSAKGWVARYLLHRIRKWDARTANGVDYFISNSEFISRRVNKIYRRESQVIYPPVDIRQFTPRPDKDDFYLTASRMVPYKRVDLIVQAFARSPERKLIVIGEGPEFKKIQGLGAPNIQFLGHQSADSLRDHLQRARAFVFAAEEDFGILPVEAQACGTPVIAYGKGGATETVRGLDQSHPTGVFFSEQTVPSLLAGIEAFEANANQLTPAHCRENAEVFSVDRFRHEFMNFVNEKWDLFQARRAEKPQTKLALSAQRS